MSPSLDFDVVVIGGGSGGLAAAFRAAEHGARVALLEPNALGGTCVNAGCVPKKAMWLAAEVAGKLRMARTLGFDCAGGAPDWTCLLASRQRYIENIHASYRRRIDAAGIVLLPQYGALRDARTVECADGVLLRAPHIVIATGSRAVRPAVTGAELGGLSDDFFAWSRAPAQVAIVGGGYVGVELAGVLQALGSRVAMFVRGSRLLTGFDTELCDQLLEDYRQYGVRVHLEHELHALERVGDGVGVHDVHGAAHGSFDAVLFATGRRPVTDGLGLDAAGVALDTDGFVVVDALGATTAPGVYAIGDVTPAPALTPVAIAAARRLMDRVVGGRADAVFDPRDVPTVVFAHPPLGRVGLTEAEARARHGDDVHVYRAGFRPMLHALADSPQRSLFKLVCVGEERRVVGIHLLGEAADEMLQGFAVALRRGITLHDLHDTVAIHPTSAEEVVLMR